MELRSREPRQMSITADTKTRVVVIEDHTEYREVIEIALGKTDDIELVGTYGAAEVALRRLEHSSGWTKPDVILLDISLPGMSGLDAISRIRRDGEDVKIIVLTQSNQEADVMRAISLGASGYLLKSATVNQIIEGIRCVMAGDAPLDTGIAKYILNTLRSALPKGKTAAVLLTKREMEILHLLADGLTKKEIAEQLCVSNSTVSTHTVHIFEKLSVQNAPAAVAQAFRLGIFSRDNE